MGRFVAVLGASFVAVVALATVNSEPALALSAQVNGTTLVLRPDPGETFRAQVSALDEDFDGVSEALRVSPSGDDRVNGGTGCAPAFEGSFTYVCSTAGGGEWGGITLVDMVGSDVVDPDDGLSDRILISDIGPRSTLTGLGGDDSLTEFDGSDGTSVLDGGPGDDSFGGGKGADEIFGGPGDDNQVRGDAGDDLVDGGTGDDFVIGSDGDDRVLGGDGVDRLLGDSQDSDDEGDGTPAGGFVDELDGGPGNDELEGGSGPDTIRGGDGVDTVSYDARNIDVGGFAISLDNARNDGQTDADGNVTEGDNVGPDGSVENVIGPFSSAESVGDAGVPEVELVGNGAPNSLDAETLRGVVYIEGGGGDDVLNGAFGDDDSTFVGGDGADEILGTDSNDFADGGPGDDELNGFSGDDGFVGGTGVDVLDGSFGNDTLITDDDGTGGDRANCGSGADVARIDAGDLTDSTCEVVQAPAPTPPTPPAPPVVPPVPPGGGGAGGGPTDQQVQQEVADQVKAAGEDLKQLGLGKLLQKGTFKAPVTAPEAGEFAATVKGAIGGKKAVTIAKGSDSFAAGDNGKLKLKLTGAGAKLLKHAKGAKDSVKATLQLRFSGADGTSADDAAKVTLK